MLLDISPNHLKIVQDILRKYLSAYEVWAFGSRAKWLAKEYSDLDLCVISQYPISFNILGLLEEAFNDSDLPYKVDIVDWSTTSASFREIIKKDRVVVQKIEVMNGEWKIKKLSDVIVNFDTRRKPVKESDRKKGFYPYYGASGIVDYVDDYIFDGDYLLVAEDGENLRTRQTPIAFIASGKFWVNNHAHILRGNEMADTRYLQYAILGTDITAYLTGAVMPKLTQGNLNRIEILCPPIKIQKQIVGVLGSLDDRITLLRETNKTLEAIAQALFKSWFIDFDPVRAKMENKIPEGMDEETAALFPDSLEESELGMIPKGWCVERLDNFIELLYGKALKAENRKLGDIPVYGSGGITGWHDTALVKNPSIIVGRKGTVGSLYWESRPFFAIDTVFYVNTKQPLTYCYYLLQTLGLSNMNTDAAVPGLNRENAYRLLVKKPLQNLVSAFDAIVAPLRASIDCNVKQAQTLANLRDTLLPRLISGQIRVGDLKSE